MASADEAVKAAIGDRSHFEVGFGRERGKSVFFLTNQMNLNGILSSRIVAPRESFGKYYVDLLQDVPGWLPILTKAPNERLVELVTSERGSGSPVIVEFPESVAGKVRTDSAVLFVPALAFADAIAVHFRSEGDLRSHRARVYRNIHNHDALLRVSPELFEVDSTFAAEIVPPVSQATGVDWQRVDKIRGALSAAVACAGTGEQLALVAALLGASGIPEGADPPSWLHWSEIDDHADGEMPHLPEGAAADHIGFRAAYEVLATRDLSESWSPSAVLGEVVSRVQAADLSKEATLILRQNLRRAQSILDAEVDFSPFRPSSRALVSSKALLLLLLRPKLEDLLSWPVSETGADDSTRVVAAVLAGRLRGLARESTEFRSVVLDDLTAAWAVRVATERGTLGGARFIGNKRGAVLMLNGVEIARRDGLLPDPGARYAKPSETR